MVDTTKLTEMEYDALRECGNVGIGNAVTALSKLVNKEITIDIPVTKFVPLSDFAKELGGPEEIVSGIFLDVGGDLTGNALFVFPEKDAKQIVDLMMGAELGTTKEIGEMEESAIKEMANIVVGAYLTSIGDLVSMKLLPEPPQNATDMVQSLVDLILINQAQISDQILIVREKINIVGQSIDGTFIVIFDKPSLEKLISGLHKLYGL